MPAEGRTSRLVPGAQPVEAETRPEVSHLTDAYRQTFCHAAVGAMTCPVGGEHLTVRSLLSPPRCRCSLGWLEGGKAMLFVGDDWAEDHHDVEIVDEGGRRLATRRVPEGEGGIAAIR
jgi:hypothetical protein